MNGRTTRPTSEAAGVEVRTRPATRLVPSVKPVAEPVAGNAAPKVAPAPPPPEQPESQMMWPMTLLPVGNAAVIVVCTGVMEAMPWMVTTSTAAAPAPPKAGCLAEVAAPVGSAEPETATATVPGIETVTGVMPATPFTLSTSVEAAPGVANCGCFAEVAAPVGRAALETVTGTVPTMIAWIEPELSTVMQRSVTDLSQTVNPCRCAVPLG